MDNQKKQKLKKKMILAVVEVVLAVLLGNIDHLLPQHMEVTGIVVRMMIIGAMFYIFYLVNADR